MPKSWAEKPVCSLSRYLRLQGKEGERQADLMLREALMQNPTREVRAEFAHLLAFRSEKSSFCLEDEDPAFAEARHEARSVLKFEPTHSLANEALAIVEMKEGKWENAEKHLLAARPGCRNIGRIDRNLAICREEIAAKKGASDVQK